MDRADMADANKRVSDVPSAAYDEKPAISESSANSIRSQTKDDEIVRGDPEKELRVIDDSAEKGEEREKSDVERVVSKQPSVNNAAAIPNGGLWAWLQVLGAFFLFFNSW
jgi:hypothetical protein